MPTKQMKAGFYAVRTGKKTGVFKTWADCEEQTKGFPNARFKKFATLEEAQYFVWAPEVSNAAPTATLVSPKNKKRSRSPDIEDESGWDVVYSDGACKGNGQVGSVAGIGVWWGPNDPRNLAERCPGDQTNNRAELIAILRVLETAPISTKPLLIKTDSRYSIDCLTTWIFRWKVNGFRNAQGEAIKNAGIVRCTSIQLEIRAHLRQRIRLQYIKGHSGDVGNDGADAMANRGTLLPAVEERDWEVLETRLSKQLKQCSVETSDIDPMLVEMEYADDFDTAVQLTPSPKMQKISSGFCEHKGQTTIAKAAPSPLKPAPLLTATEASPWTSSKGRPSPLPVPSTPRDEEIEVSPEKCSATPALAQPQSMPLKGSSTVMFTLPPIAPVKYEEVNFDDYMDCVLDDGDLANELSD